jgi:hypothetical protein
MEKQEFINLLFRGWTDKKISIDHVMQTIKLNGYDATITTQHHMIHHSFHKMKKSCAPLFPVKVVRTLFDTLSETQYREPGVWCIGEPHISIGRLVLCNLSKLPTGNWLTNKYVYELNYYVLCIT